MKLELWGWTGFFAGQGYSGVPGRVASAARDRFLIWTEAGEVEAGVSGRLRNASEAWPAVGDWVALRENGLVIEQDTHGHRVRCRAGSGKGGRGGSKDKAGGAPFWTHRPHEIMVRTTWRWRGLRAANQSGCSQLAAVPDQTWIGPASSADVRS